MDRFLNQHGLQHLIEKIETGVLTTQEYFNVKTLGSNPTEGTAFLFKLVVANEQEPWIIKYRITSEITTDSNSKQVATVTLGGIGNELSYYQSQNIIYDKARRGAESHCIALHSLEHLVGLNIQNRPAQPHSILVELQFLKGCNVLFFNNAHMLSELIDNDNQLSEFILKQVPFNINGTMEDTTFSVDLAAVAFSGSYNDLTDKPELLDVKADDSQENLIFFK